MLKYILPLMLCADVACAQSSGPIFGTSATSNTLTFCGSTNGTGCTLPELRDAVIQLRDGRLVLIRKIERCPDVATALAASGDVAKAECFK